MDGLSGPSFVDAAEAAVPSQVTNPSMSPDSSSLATDGSGDSAPTPTPTSSLGDSSGGDDPPKVIKFNGKVAGNVENRILTPDDDGVAKVRWDRNSDSVAVTWVAWLMPGIRDNGTTPMPIFNNTVGSKPQSDVLQFLTSGKHCPRRFDKGRAGVS